MPAPFTCPTRNCRRTDEHDARGCVVARTLRGAGPDEPVPDDLRADLEAAVPSIGRPVPPDWSERMAASLAPLDEPYFTSRRFKP